MILSESLARESHIDMGNRGFLAEAGVMSLSASPDAAVRTHGDFCRPFYETRPIFQAVRARLKARGATMGGLTQADWQAA